MQHTSPTDEFAEAMWDKVIALNLSAPFHAVKAALPHMKKKNWGRIINTGNQLLTSCLFMACSFCSWSCWKCKQICLCCIQAWTCWFYKGSCFRNSSNRYPSPYFPQLTMLTTLLQESLPTVLDLDGF
jgi:hypothetical protein